MDKLAPAIAWIKEHGFWLANGLLLLLMIGIWYLQTDGLNQATKKNEQKIKGEFGTAQRIRTQKPEDLSAEVAPLHPNRTTKEGMQTELERTVESVIAAWKLRVDAQKKLLVFPAVIGNDQFEKVFAKYNPPETFPVKYADFRTIEPLLSLYRLKIKDHMINICGRDGVRTNWRWDPANYEQTEEFDNASSSRDNSSDLGSNDGDQRFEVKEEDASRFAVLWSDVNQKLWHDKLTLFRGRDDHNKESRNPTPLQCYMLQQDLWVLEAMFNVIRDLNGDSTATDTSAIKQIAHIGIGREGTPRLGKLHDVDKRFGPEIQATDETTTADDEFGFGSSSSSSSGISSSGNSEFGVTFSEEIVGVDTESQYDPLNSPDVGNPIVERLPPFHEMYVDTKLEPISSEEVLKVVKGEALPETNLELLIAKRLPVRIALKMDERKIPDFMAACINSPFSFEIQQVRINRHTPAGESIVLGGGESTSDYNNNQSDNSSTSFNQVLPVETRVNYDVNVEFFGIIKIYNPVRADLIRKAAGLEPEEPAPSGNVEPDPSDSAAIRTRSTGLHTAG